MSWARISLCFKRSPYFQEIVFKQTHRISRKKITLANCFPVKSPHTCFHTSSFIFKNKDLVPTEKELASRMQYFEQVQTKDKKNFLQIIKTYNEYDKTKRGHLEFIYAALKYMEDYGVEGDLETYKQLMNVFPKGRMIPKNLIQAEFFHFARHQECAVYMLDRMEFTGIMPDKEMKEIILNVFGKSSSVFKKYSRMIYWMPKFKNANPYLLPDPLPSDIKELARLALKKMSVDTRTKIMEYDAKELEDSADKTWVMSAQSPVQQKLINEHPEDKPLFVEGPFLVWLRRLSMTYFILRADPKFYPEIEVDDDDVSNLSLYMFGEKKPKEMVLRPQSVHEQEDGIIMGICCTGTSSKDSLLSWIRFLRKTNPKLDSIQVLFKLKTSPTDLVAVNINKIEVNENSEEDASNVKSSS